MISCEKELPKSQCAVTVLASNGKETKEFEGYFFDEFYGIPINEFRVVAHDLKKWKITHWKPRQA